MPSASVFTKRLVSRRLTPTVLKALWSSFRVDELSAGGRVDVVVSESWSTAMQAYANPVVPSRMDVEHLAMIRENVRSHLKRTAELCDAIGLQILDVAPQDHQGARE